MSETPRHDELSKHKRHENLADTMYWGRQYSLLARTLERELAAAQSDIARLAQSNAELRHFLNEALERIESSLESAGPLEHEWSVDDRQFCEAARRALSGEGE